MLLLMLISCLVWSQERDLVAVHHARRDGKNRLLRNNPAVNSDTSTPTEKISTNVIGMRKRVRQ